ncbi:hypothetical protein CGH41_23740, partial [Vibrio parahaemolyticus]
MQKKQLHFQEDVEQLEEEAISLGLLEKPNEDMKETLSSLKSIAESNIEQFSEAGIKLKDLESKQLELNRKLQQFKRFNEDFSKYQSLLKESGDSILPIDYILDRYSETLPGTHTSDLLLALEEQLSGV